MTETPARRGFRGYVAFLAMCVVFPLLWARSMAFARENEGRDPRARSRTAIAIVAGVVLFGIGLYGMHGFIAQAEGNVLVENPVGGFLVAGDVAHGVYESLDARIEKATGEGEYQAQVELVKSKDNSIAIIERNLAAARGNADNATAQGFEEKLALTRTERADAERMVAALEENHALYLRLVPIMEKGPRSIGLVPTNSFPADRELRAEVAAAEARGVTFDGMAENTDKALAVKDKAVADMYAFMVWLVYPGLVGLLFAPLVWALGKTLRRGFDESTSVGFKPYPAGAAAWFLALGAFGVPAIFFAAWAFQDINNRAAEGQIAL